MADTNLIEQEVKDLKEDIDITIDWIVRHMHDPSITFVQMLDTKLVLDNLCADWLYIYGEDETDEMFNWRTIYKPVLESIIQNSRVCLV